MTMVSSSVPVVVEDIFQNSFLSSPTDKDFLEGVYDPVCQGFVTEKGRRTSLEQTKYENEMEEEIPGVSQSLLFFLHF